MEIVEFGDEIFGGVVTTPGTVNRGLEFESRSWRRQEGKERVEGTTKAVSDNTGVSQCQ